MTITDYELVSICKFGLDDYKFRRDLIAVPQDRFANFDSFRKYVASYSAQLRSIETSSVSLSTKRSSRPPIECAGASVNSSKPRQVCFQYRDHGKCNRGDVCRFLHDHGSSLKTIGPGAPSENVSKSSGYSVPSVKPVVWSASQAQVSSNQIVSVASAECSRADTALSMQFMVQCPKVQVQLSHPEGGSTVMIPQALLDSGAACCLVSCDLASFLVKKRASVSTIFQPFVCFCETAL